MTNSKNFWAATAFACLVLAAVSGHAVYTRLAVHFLSDTVEIKPKPVPLPPRLPDDEIKEEPEAAEAGAGGKASAQPAAKAGEDGPAAKGKQERAEEPGRQKAVKTAFEYKNASAKSVLLAGSFTKWREVKMVKKAGTWKAEPYILPGNYLYHFVVDGRKVLDPGKPKAPMGESMVSVGDPAD